MILSDVGVFFQKMATEKLRSSRSTFFWGGLWMGYLLSGSKRLQLSGPIPRMSPSSSEFLPQTSLLAGWSVFFIAGDIHIILLLVYSQMIYGVCVFNHLIWYWVEEKWGAPTSHRLFTSHFSRWHISNCISYKWERPVCHTYIILIIAFNLPTISSFFPWFLRGPRDLFVRMYIYIYTCMYVWE